MIFDIAVVIFVVILSLVMMKKGGMHAILSLVGLVLSVVVAFSVYPVLSEVMYDTPLPGNLEVIVSEALMADESVTSLEAIDAMPDFVKNVINVQAEDAVNTMIEDVSKSVTRVIIDVITFILLIIVTKIIIALITGALNLTMKLPVLSQLNSLVGLLCGIVVSLVIVWLAVAATSVLGTSNEMVASWIEGSRVVEIFSDIAPF